MVKREKPQVRYLRTREAGEYTRLGERAIRKLVVDGKLPVIQNGDHNSPYILDVYDLDAYMQALKLTR